MAGELKRRVKSKGSANKHDLDPEDEISTPKAVPAKETDLHHFIALSVVTVLAILVRFVKIGTPDTVVFDEVHFGKFASFYLERTYFFDLHPPFAKLLIAAAGWLVGYDGHFKFESIGDPYITNNVPYVALRSFLAIQGTAVIPLVYLSMKTLNFSVAACFLSSLIICFDNAHVIDSRLILLDSTLILSVALTIYCYVKFSTYRRSPFTKMWWNWLFAVGVSLSCVISTKYVGVFTYVMIGCGVLHELWILLDYRRGNSMDIIAQHFLARLWTLIIIPLCIYLGWFYLHFAILTKSGPGDAFMSAEFQETLGESPLVKLSKQVHYGDEVTIKNKETLSYLHSHNYQYPLRYEDGRVSSNGQQVTCVVLNETEASADWNSRWQILPGQAGVALHLELYSLSPFRLMHKASGGFLLAHDVASPLRPTNEEFTVVHGEVAEKRYNETLFVLRPPVKNPSAEKIRTKASFMRLIHRDTVVAMWTQGKDPLPDWAFHQGEISGNKQLEAPGNIWLLDNIANLSPEDPRALSKPKEIKKINFFKKWWELQGLMFEHNNKLSSEHPFASQPDAWPLSLSGISFWNDNPTRRQIFFVGNIVGFWLELALIVIFAVLVLVDQLFTRRNIKLIDARASSRLYNTIGFLFVGWAAHYFPFFLMNRQKFLHHYLPAHLIAAMLAGGLLEFVVFHAPLVYPTVSKKIVTPQIKMWLIVLICSTAIIGCFAYFSVITYGYSMDVESLKARQWFDIKLHYAK